MSTPHRATPDQWHNLLQYRKLDRRIPDHVSVTLELAARIVALEAAQHAHADVSRLSDAEREQMANELAKPAAWRPLEVETTYGSEHAAAAQQILNRRMVVEGTFEHGGETYRFKAKPERDGAMSELRAASAEAGRGGILPVEYVDADGDGISILMEPADETGQACWVVRNSRRVSPFEEFPTPEAAYAAHQTRAEQSPAKSPPTTEARPGGLVERVAEAMQPGTFDWSAYEGEARAAIREIAAAARALHLDGVVATWETVAQWLEREANR